MHKGFEATLAFYRVFVAYMSDDLDVLFLRPTSVFTCDAAKGAYGKVIPLAADSVEKTATVHRDYT